MTLVTSYMTWVVNNPTHSGSEGPKDSKGAVPLAGCSGDQGEGFEPVRSSEVHHCLSFVCEHVQLAG